MHTLLLSAITACAAAQPVLPTITLTRDDTAITESCLIRIPPGTIIQDANNNGVIHIETDDVTISFLEGDDPATPFALVGSDINDNWNTFTGIGVRVRNASNVTLRDLRIRGYKVAVLATNTPGLTVEHADLSDNYRQRLRSTPLREDASDWLYPHDNDDRQWVTSHGAALCVERSENVTIKNITVRRGQNGIILDRVNHSQIYDNDCSFLSGWGLAAWRSSDNIISRNAFDFCVRGHSEGVYNRGQDSAGILFFEQCNRNTVAQNSATHSGDGFFGFAGKEALGQSPKPADADWSYARVGCNDNVFLSNDFSDSPAHGWEMTFSEGNVLHDNTIVRNAICGVWAGYSSDTIITDNKFFANGAMPYGDQGGAINIEHGSGNIIASNQFVSDTTAVRLWWDDDGQLLDLPGVKAGYRGVSGNVISGNDLILLNRYEGFFKGPRHEGRAYLGYWFQDASGERFGSNTVTDNTLTNERGFEITEFKYEPGTEPDSTAPIPARPDPELPPIPGTHHPIGRLGTEFFGREAIIMNEWGPWDHQTPMLRLRERTASKAVYEYFGFNEDPQCSPPLDTPGDGSPIAATTREIPRTLSHRTHEFAISTTEPGVHEYDFDISSRGYTHRLTGTLINTTWNVQLWSYEHDPLTDYPAWRAEADKQNILRLTLPALDFNFQSRSPADLSMITNEQAANAGITHDRFATLASTTIPLTAGRWRIRTLSDDGIRVRADGTTIIERWTIHGPTPDEAIVTLKKDRELTLEVEHFERDGWAALSLTIEPAD